MRSLLVVAALLACVVAQELPKFNARLNETTVGGLSSGAYFAVQMQVAYSATIKGVAVFAGGPYDCAQGSEITALTTCMTALPSPPDASSSIFTTDARARLGLIDPTSNLAASYVYMYTGVLDGKVKPEVVAALNQYYLNYVPPSHVVFVNNVTSAHTQPTDDPINSNPCWLSSSPYISDCQYDGAGFALNHIFGAPLANARNNGNLSGRVVSFSQADYMPNGAAPDSASLAQTGYLYVPQSCASGAHCKIHVEFHGCEQSYDWVGLDYVLHSGFNKWADTNNIVVVYPQTIASYLGPSNPDGCWDWWGYAGSDYDVKSGTQSQFSYNVMKALTSN